jgi:hypothetical protein
MLLRVRLLRDVTIQSRVTQEYGRVRGVLALQLERGSLSGSPAVSCGRLAASAFISMAIASSHPGNFVGGTGEQCNNMGMIPRFRHSVIPGWRWRKPAA